MAGLALRRCFPVSLIVLGVAAALVMAFPGLAIIGLFLGILPGVALSFAPTLFLYTFAWWLIQALLRWVWRATAGADMNAWPVRIATGLVSAIVVGTPAFAIPRSINAPLADTMAALRADDREHAGPISLPPVVAVMMPNAFNSRERLFCEEVCQRLLYNRAVSRVILVDSPLPGRSSRTSRPLTGSKRAIAVPRRLSRAGRSCGAERRRDAGRICAAVCLRVWQRANAL